MKNTLLILFIVLLAACNARERSYGASGESRAMAAFAPEAKIGKPQADMAMPEVAERKLIKNGDLSFETSDVKKTKAAVDAICKEFEALVSNESQNNYSERLQYSQTIRVKADRFDALVQKIEAEAKRVENKSVGVQDVTEEFIDVEARLKTKKELEARYQEILKDAKNVQDIVAIEGQMNAVRAEIESMEGRLKYLNNQVDYSTLNVSYYEELGTDFGFGSKLARSLGEGWDNLLAALIFLVNLWPFVLIAVLSVAGALRFKKKKRKKAA